MSFTLPWTINKLVSTHINDANSITGTYGTVSLKVNGKTELTGDTVMVNKVGIGKNVSTYALDVNGSINSTSLNTPLLTTQNEKINPVQTPISISNANFATPSQSLNSFNTITSPYSSITGWTISLFSGTAPSVFIGRGFTALVNTYETLFPEYPFFIQYFSVQSSTIYQMNLVQSLTFPETGEYILTMYVWGEYNRYSIVNNVTVSCGNGTISNFTGVEQQWTKLVLKFQILTSGANNLTISIKNTNGTDSGLSISGVKIVKQNGLIVTDNTNTNNQLITTTGIYTTGIYNSGTLENFGTIKNIGPFSLSLPYSSGSLVLGSSTYGSYRNDDIGRYNVIVGQSNVVSSPSIAINLDSCLFIGYAAGEQAQRLVRCHYIGYQCGRWSNGSVSQGNIRDNVCYGYQSGFAMGYSAGNHQQNVLIGNYTMSNFYAGSTLLNTCIGHNSMSGVSFVNTTRNYNTVIGGSSLLNISSSNNSSIGYSNANNILNTGSNNNTFVGSNVCPTQSGSTNVLLNCLFLGSNSDVSIASSYTASTCIGYNSRITGSNQIILGTSTEITYTMGGLTIPVSTILTLLGNISANALTITPVQLSFLSNVTGGAIPSTVITNTSFVALTGAQTVAGVKTFSSAPVMSGASISTGTIPNGALVNGANYITTNLTQTITATSLTVTPAQFAFLNRVLVSPSPNAGLIPQTAISNYTEWLKATTTATITANWTISGTWTISGAMSFTANPTFNVDGIDVFAIDNTTVPRFLEIGSTTPVTIDSVYTFTVNPIFNDDAIPVAKINNTTTPRFVDLTNVQTITAQKTFNGGLIANTILTDTLTLSGKSQIESISVLASSSTAYNWSYGNANTVVITGSIAQVFRFPNPTTAGLGTIVNIVIQDTSVLTVRCLLGSGFNVVDSENNSVLVITYPSTVKYVSFMCVSTGTAAWKYIGGQLPNAGIVPLNSGNNVFSGLVNTFNGDLNLGATSGNFINVIGSLYTPVNSTTITPTELSYVSGTTSSIQGQLNPLITKTTGISYSSPDTTISDKLFVNTIDGIATGTLTLGINTSSGVNIAGELYVKNNAQKINGYITLSGTSNTLSKPLSEYYTLSTATTGALTLPAIDATMYGSQITFTKTSAAAIWTINRGGTDTFRLYKSNSTATETSVSLEYNETVLRIVATQGGIWDVIQTDIFYNAATDWVCGTQYFPMLMNPTNITGAVNWNTTLPSAFYGIQGFSITATSNITLPLSTNVNVPNGLRIKFRRVGGTLATALTATASTGDTIMANNALATTAAGTAVVLVTSSAYWGELYLNKTTKVWYCM